MYTPVSNENGADAFTFRVSDGIATSEMANVDIWITPVNDVPVGQSYALTSMKTARFNISWTHRMLKMIR
jgi:hypothetical protein